MAIKIRGTDNYGSGAYLASRGKRTHNGIDICCGHADAITAHSPGIVTKIGYPYSQGSPQPHLSDAQRAKYLAKKALRYVQVTDSRSVDARYFYVLPGVEIGDAVEKGSTLGTAQGVGHIYPGIVEHYHFECLIIINGNKVFINPEQYIKAFL